MFFNTGSFASQALQNIIDNQQSYELCFA